MKGASAIDHDQLRWTNRLQLYGAGPRRLSQLRTFSRMMKPAHIHRLDTVHLGVQSDCISQEEELATASSGEYIYIYGYI